MSRPTPRDRSNIRRRARGAAGPPERPRRRARRRGSRGAARSWAWGTRSGRRTPPRAPPRAARCPGAPRGPATSASASSAVRKLWPSGGQGLHVQADDARRRAMLAAIAKKRGAQPGRAVRAKTPRARLNPRAARGSACCCFLSPPRGRAVAHVSNFSRARRVPFWAPTDWCAAERGAAERLGRPRNRGGGAERRAYPVKRRRATGVAGVATGRNSSGPAVR